VNPIHSCLKRLVGISVSIFRTRYVHWTTPLTSSLPLGTLADLARSKAELVAENALLRQQLIILKRQVKRPACTKTDRILLVLLARAVRAWKQTLFIVQPETLLRWHRELFRLYWKRRSKVCSHKPKVAAETIAFVREMAKENQLWGAERMRGELLKLGIRVCKRTIQKHMRHVRSPQPNGQKWATFLHNHAEQIWACDFLQVTDLFFRPLFAFFIIELKSRKVIHVGVTRSPTDPDGPLSGPRCRRGSRRALVRSRYRQNRPEHQPGCRIAKLFYTRSTFTAFVREQSARSGGRLSRPLSRGSGPSGYPAEPLVSYRFNRQSSGWNPPQVIRAFGAHNQKLTGDHTVVQFIHDLFLDAVPPDRAGH